MSCLDDPARLDPVHNHKVRLGRISLVGAGPGAADLLTLRAIRCLSKADVVFYDRLVDPEALEFVRAGAESVFVGKEVGAHSWPQARIDAAIVCAALQGKQVVRLKSGDPSIFGRAAEEIAAARTHGIEVEVSPGITAASAAAASLCRPLTERGISDRLVLATGTCCSGDMPENIAELARPGTTMVFYMAMQHLHTLSHTLLSCGVAADQRITVAANISKPDERHLETTAAQLVADCAGAGLTNPAVILMTLDKTTTPRQPSTLSCLKQGTLAEA